MPLKHKPDKNARDAAEQAAQVGFLEQGTVKQAPNHTLGEDNSHVVKVNVAGVEEWADVSIGSGSDIYLPQPGDTVLVGELATGKLIVMDVLYMSEDEVPSYTSGERRLGHALSDSNIYFDAQGSVTVEHESGASVTLSNGDITINHDGTATGSILLADENGTTSPVARKGDSVEVTLSDGSTGTGQITGGSSSVESS